MPSTDPIDLSLRTNSTYNFKILSLDGGGLRAAFTAAFLDGLESILRETGQLEPNESIASYFDLIAGTSTGGIIATALAMGRDAASILAFFQQQGPKVFDRQPRTKLRKTLQFLPDRVLGLFGQDTDSIMRAKYGSLPLDQAITELLGSKTMADAKFRLIVPASRLTVGRPIVFRTAHLPGQIRDKQISAKDVAMATTATPMLFPPHRIENPAQPGQYVDGGIWANHPGLLAFSDAMRISKLSSSEKSEFSVPSFSMDNIQLLSIGNGQSPSSSEMPPEKAGLKTWLPRLMDHILTTQSQGTHVILRHMMAPGNYHRINFDHNGWKLDGIDRLQTLIDLGHCEARNLSSRIPSTFFRSKANQFTSL